MDKRFSQLSSEGGDEFAPPGPGQLHTIESLNDMHGYSGVSMGSSVDEKSAL